MCGIELIKIVYLKEGLSSVLQIPSNCFIMIIICIVSLSSASYSTGYSEVLSASKPQGNQTAFKQRRNERETQTKILLGDENRFNKEGPTMAKTLFWARVISTEETRMSRRFADWRGQEDTLLR